MKRRICVFLQQAYISAILFLIGPAIRHEIQRREIEQEKQAAARSAQSKKLSEAISKRVDASLMGQFGRDA